MPFAGASGLYGGTNMWVLILFYFSGGAPSVAMHDFTNRAACEEALKAAHIVQKQLRGAPQVAGTCVSKE